MGVNEKIIADIKNKGLIKTEYEKYLYRKKVLSFEEFLDRNFCFTNSIENDIFYFDSDDYGEYGLMLNKEDLKIIYEKIYLPHIKNDPY